MKKILFTISIGFLAGIFFYSCNKKANGPSSWTVASPDSTIQANIQLSVDGKLSYSVSQGQDTVIGSSPLGLVRVDQAFDSLVFIEAAPIATINETYTMLTGKRKENVNNARELTLTFKTGKDAKIQIIFRAYNEGVAFKYNFPETDATPYTIIKEKTGFAVGKEGKAWLQNQGLPSEWGPAYEEFYTFGTNIATNAPDSSGWSFPALFQAKSKWVFITEAGLDKTYAGTRLAQNCDDGIYKIRFPMVGDGLGTGNVFPSNSLPWATPWRVISVSNNIGTIFESNLVHHLSAPQIGGDFSWVKPGRASWSWWGEHDSPKDFKRLKDYVDFAKSVQWEYCLIDANWDLMKNGGTVEDLAKYANSKNVGLLLWYNSGGPHNKVTERPRDIMNDAAKRKAEFKKIRAWGVKGVKIDFFQSDKQDIINLYLDILKDAADEHIMVVFHGCTLPRGWSRTYPNLVSMEGIRGAEQYGWSQDFAIKAAKHNTVIAFTRNIVGSMDYTPATFSDYETSKHQTTNAHELALPVVFESGITHWADRVDSYKKQDQKIKELMKVIPTAWDETKFISGEPNSAVIVARKKGDQWFVAGINGDSTSKDMQIELPFVKEGSYKISIYGDGKSNREISVKDTTFTPGGSFTVKISPKGGFTAWLRK